MFVCLFSFVHAGAKMVNNAIEDKDETGREVEMEKQWGGRKKNRGQKSVLCKCCTHLQSFSSCDGCVAIALSKVVAGKRA